MHSYATIGALHSAHRVSPAQRRRHRGSGVAAGLDGRGDDRSRVRRRSGATSTERYRVLPGRGLAVTEATLDRGRRLVCAPDARSPRGTFPRRRATGSGTRSARYRATSPYPIPTLRSPARPTSFSRRLALELALRTFLQTSVDVVASRCPRHVSSPSSSTGKSSRARSTSSLWQSRSAAIRRACCFRVAAGGRRPSRRPRVFVSTGARASSQTAGTSGQAFRAGQA